jgi:hypothetical protein
MRRSGNSSDTYAPATGRTAGSAADCESVIDNDLTADAMARLHLFPTRHQHRHGEN